MRDDFIKFQKFERISEEEDRKNTYGSYLPLL